ncbi:alpha/beta hydrolase [bacterium]|nr:alpha/beta hydrolase [bacterium]
MGTSTRIIEGAAVHESGAGPGLVLLHANGGDHRDFAPVIDRLAGWHRVHAIDWPGWGESEPAGSLTATGYAALLPRVLDRLGSGPVVLLGNSVGGFAAILAAAARPDLVRALVLVDPGGFTPRWPGTIAACRAIGSQRLAPSMMRILPRLYLRRPGPAVDAIRSRSVEMSSDPQLVRVFASIWRSFAEPEHDAREAARRVKAPTLLVWGRRDPVLPWFVDGRRACRALPGAEVVTLPCGHQAYAEMPEEFLAAVDPFLRSIRREVS